MNSYSDPKQETSEPLLAGEPEYREYPPVPPQLRSPVYPTVPSFPPGHTPLVGMPVPPMQAVPYPYGPAGQGPRLSTPQSIASLPTTKASSRGWIILLGSIGMAILALGGVLVYAFSQIPSSHSTSTNASSQNTSQPGVVHLGQSLTVNGLTTTVLSVEALEGDGKTNPDAGNKFLVVHVQLHNDQSTTQFYNAFDFHVFSSDNQERDVELITPNTYTANQQLFEDDLAPNDTVTGDLLIQVPANDHNAKLGWNPDGVTSDSAYEWNLDL